MLSSVAGVVCLILGLLGIVFWWSQLGDVLRGLIPLVLLVVGLIALASGLTRKHREGASDDDSGRDS